MDFDENLGTQRVLVIILKFKKKNFRKFFLTLLGPVEFSGSRATSRRSNPHNSAKNYRTENLKYVLESS